MVYITDEVKRREWMLFSMSQKMWVKMIQEIILSEVGRDATLGRVAQLF